MNSVVDEIRIALHAVWNRRWLALAIAWGICVLGWLVLAMVPNSYESKARIFVQMYDPLADELDLKGGDRKRAIDRVSQTLTSSVNLQKIIRQTRIGEDVSTPRQMDGAVAALEKSVKVVSDDANIFEITAVSNNGGLSDTENAKLAQDIVQKMIDLFREENLAGGRGELSESIAFVNQQLADRQKDLEAAEQKRLAFEAQHPELARGSAGVIQRLESSRAELRGVEADLSAAQSTLASINGQLAGTPATIAVAGPGGGARGALGQAQADLAALRGRGMTESHPDVIALKNQITALRATALTDTGGVSGAPNPAYTSLQSMKIERQATVQALMARRGSLQAEIAAVSAQNINNPELAAEAQRISRDYDVLKQQYDKLLEDRERIRLRGQVETERSSVKFEVVDKPSAPRAPSAPNRPILLLGILIAGLGAGAAAAYGVNQLRGGFATTAKLQKATGLPVLGAISLVTTTAAREAQRRSNKLFYAATAGLCVLFAVLLVVEFVQVRMVAI